MDSASSVGTIHRNTPRGIAPSTSSPRPSKYVFEDIKYCSDIEPIDASRFMLEYVSGSIPFTNEEERKAYVNENICKCLEKHKCWDYEEESRLVLREPTPWVYGQHNSLTKQERLFHYDFSQLVGIILGAKMDNMERERIIDIIKLKRESLWPQTKTVKRIFDFAVFEASISDKSRDVIIEPHMILAGSNDVKKDEERFERVFSDWKQGKALVIEGKNGKSEYIK